MDTTVKEIGAAIITALRAAHYMESTIYNYHKTIRALDAFIQNHGGTYTPSLGEQFSQLTIGMRTKKTIVSRRRIYARLTRIFDSYLLTGKVDLSMCKRSIAAYPSSTHFAALLDSWIKNMNKRDLSSSTRHYYTRLARNYLMFLEDKGIHCLDLADGSSIIEFLGSLASSCSESSIHCAISSFRPFFKFARRPDLVDAINFVRAHRSHRIVPVIEQCQEKLVVNACINEKVGARDAAITLLALATGLRAQDIIGLRLSDIDWRGQTINIVQQKTGNLLSLPLPSLIAQKLAGYILNERPSSDVDHVFLRRIAPHVAFADHASVHQVLTKTFQKAGTTYTNMGTQLLRHNAASKLVQAGTPLPTIAAVLGHASVDSTNIYISVDEQRLLQCVLPLPIGAQS